MDYEKITNYLELLYVIVSTNDMEELMANVTFVTDKDRDEIKTLINQCKNIKKDVI